MCIKEALIKPFDSSTSSELAANGNCLLPFVVSLSNHERKQVNQTFLKRLPRQRGFTLFELLLLVVVFAIALAGILAVYNTTIVRSADPMARKQAMAVAESMMEEILLMPFAQSGWSGAATQANRTSFDDVRDYNGFSTSGVFRIDDDIAPIPGLAQYNVAVAIAPVNINPVTGNALQVTVTVTGPAGAGYTLNGHKLNY